MKKLICALSVIAACGLQAADHVTITNSGGVKNYHVKVCDFDAPESCSKLKKVNTRGETKIKLEDIKMDADAEDKEAAGKCVKRIRLYNIEFYKGGVPTAVLSSVMPGSPVVLSDRYAFYTQMVPTEASEQLE